MEEHANILAINLMKRVKTTRRLERKFLDATGRMLFNTFINCQTYY